MVTSRPLTQCPRSIFTDFLSELFHSVLFYITVVFDTGLSTQEVSGAGLEASAGAGRWIFGLGRYRAMVSSRVQHCTVHVQYRDVALYGTVLYFQILDFENDPVL